MHSSAGVTWRDQQKRFSSYCVCKKSDRRSGRDGHRSTKAFGAKLYTERRESECISAEICAAHTHTKNNNCLPPISGNEAHNLLLNCSRAIFAAAEHQIGSNYFLGENYYLRLVHVRSRKTRREEKRAKQLQYIFHFIMISVVGIRRTQRARKRTAIRVQQTLIFNGRQLAF